MHLPTNGPQDLVALGARGLVGSREVVASRAEAIRRPRPARSRRARGRRSVADAPELSHPRPAQGHPSSGVTRNILSLVSAHVIEHGVRAC